MTHSLKTDVNLAIRPKKIISNILVSIPVTHENKLHVNCFCSFSPFDSEHSDTQLLYIGFYSLKSDISLVFKSVQIFCTYSCTKIHIQTSGWKECFKQVHKHYFILDSNQIPLNFLLHFFFHILTFVPICSWAAGNKLCTLQEKETLGFLEQIRLCQPMDRLCICFELTESKVISALLSARKFVSPQDFCRIGAYYEVPSVSLYVFPNWTLVSLWTKCYYILNSLNLENLTGNSSLIKMWQYGRFITRKSVRITLYIRLNSGYNDTCCRHKFWEILNTFFVYKFF